MRARCAGTFDYHDDKRVIEFGEDLPTGQTSTKGIGELKREDYAEGRIVL